jgi:outer membrane protein W
MTTKIKTMAMALLATMSVTSTKLVAQDKAVENKTTFSFETDPSTFLFKGYAFHIRIKPKNSQHLVIGAGVYALDLPSFLVNLNAENKNKGWNVRINTAASLFGEYYFKEANNKWFVGLQTGVQNYKNTQDESANKENKYRNLLIMPSLGYNWHPFKNGLYVKPWIGLGYTTKISGDNSSYKISPITSFVTVHVGYTFN